MPPGATGIDDLVGLDVLAERPFTLELASGRLTFETAESLVERTAGATELPIRFQRQAGGASLTVMAPVSSSSGSRA